MLAASCGRQPAPTRAAPTPQIRPGCCYYLSATCTAECYDHNHQVLHELGYRFRAAAAEYADVAGCAAPYEHCTRQALAGYRSTAASGQLIALRDGDSLAGARPVLSSSVVQLAGGRASLADSAITLASASWLESSGSSLLLDRCARAPASRRRRAAPQPRSRPQPAAPLRRRSKVVHQAWGMSSIDASDWQLRRGSAAVFRDVLLSLTASNLTLDRSTLVFGQSAGGPPPAAPRLAPLAPAMLARGANISASGSALLIQGAGAVFWRDCAVSLRDSTLTIQDSNLFVFDSSLFLRNARIVLVNSGLWLYNTPVSGDRAVTSGPVRSLGGAPVLMEAGVTASVRLSSRGG